MTTDFRALCAELLEAYEIELDELRFDNRLAKRARAALAEPEPEGPTDEELDELFVEIDQSGEPESWRSYARAVLTRWGRPAPQPADGEVAELVAWLEDISGEVEMEDYAIVHSSRLATRAATLLERLSPSQPS